MGYKASRLVMAVICAVALLALPMAASCSSVVSAVGTLTGSSSSSQANDSYYLGIDGSGHIALYMGAPKEGSIPIRTTDVIAADLHETVVAGLREGIAFESYEDALERINDYREAAKATAASREAEKAAREGAEAAAEAEGAAIATAEEAAREEAAQLDAAAAVPAAPEQGESAASTAEPAASPASDEQAPAGEFWGVWLDTFTDLDKAYACADKAKAEGFASEVFEVTNWGESSYVVGAGEFSTKSEAQAVLSRAYELGYTAAYLHTAARQ